MTRAVDWLVNRHAAALPLKPGGRKTSITLAAFKHLRDTHQISRPMLVIAPLRVCRQTWRQEAAKWEQFKDLTFGLLHGPKKDDMLKVLDKDIYLINPEGISWLAHKFFGRELPFDIVTIDELTKFKNSQADRSKELRPRLRGARWRWGLTGSLSPNGHMDLFGQMLILDDGAALGRYITHYRDQYFQLGYNGFDYTLMPGAESRIVQKLAPYWFPMNEADYAQLPPLVDDPINIELEGKARSTYDKMKKDMLAELPEGIVTAANSAACYSKLSQMANGAVYAGDAKQVVAHVHDLKLEAIEELLEELQGEPLLVAYEFNHDLDRLRERFGVLDKATGRTVLPYLGKGTTAAQESAWIAAWNRGELPMLAAHPASAGHGLNMQGASAAHVCWFGITWDFELYDQFIRRIWRDGTKALQIFNHLLIVKGTIDELKLAALHDKDTTQGRLIRALNSVIRHNAETLAAGGTAAHDGDETMVAKLSRPGTTAAQPAAAAGEVRPKGWGQKVPAEAPAPAPVEQQERIKTQLRGEAPAADTSATRAAFGQRVAAQRDAVESGQEAIPSAEIPPRAEPVRRTRAAKPDPEPVAANDHVQARVDLLAAIIVSDPAATVEDITGVADELWAWAIQ